MHHVFLLQIAHQSDATNDFFSMFCNKIRKKAEKWYFVCFSRGLSTHAWFSQGSARNLNFNLNILKQARTCLKKNLKYE